MQSNKDLWIAVSIGVTSTAVFFTLIGMKNTLLGGEIAVPGASSWLFHQIALTALCVPSMLIGGWAFFRFLKRLEVSFSAAHFSASGLGLLAAHILFSWFIPAAAFFAPFF